ncbi:MAG TPA: polyketide synthase dehydratase domain-containing protein, partial [Ktedonobacteraceae bacterium]|nr:polyketide synthase dehydratase domain-containing protein [Ktedonobacteraceae bacterium]
MGLLVSSLEQLAEKLKAYVAGQDDVQDIYIGDTKGNQKALALFTTDQDLQQAVEKWMVNKKLGKLLELWVKGLEVDWKKLYGEKAPRRLRLPLYPFAQERYWIDVEQNGPARGGMVTTGMLHPLLHRNTSDLSEQRYSSTFTGEEFFLADHQVRMESGTLEKVLPGVACLEMARAAIQLAWPAPSDSSVLELRNTLWLKPIILSANRELSIALSPSGDEHTNYEIYEENNGEEIVYCQGQALWTNDVISTATIQIEKLRAQLTDQTPSSATLYSTFEHAGLPYGPSLQPIVNVHCGDQQVCAELRLPINVGGTDGYVLHPSTMQGALQAVAVGLLDSESESRQRELPHSLESLRIIAPCKREMIAWVRYTRDSRAGRPVIKADVDLCDQSGSICVQMRGFTSRPWLQSIDLAPVPSVLPRVSIASPIWQAISVDVFGPASGDEYKQHHSVVCELPGINPAQLEQLVPNSKSILLRTENHIGQRYTEYAQACFERIQTILRSHPEGKVLMQVVVPDHEEQTILAGLSGLLKTASLENPQFFGQVILVPRQITTEDLGWRLQQEKGGSLEPLVRYQQE